MKLVVGLGNPGRKYAETRHNVGFQVAATLASRFGQSTPRSKFQGEIVEGLIGTEKLLLLCPNTYMNRSGSSVLAARDFYRLELSDLIVVCDDLSLPLGKLRMRKRGSSGGQNGLRDIITRLGSEEFPRLRIGSTRSLLPWLAAIASSCCWAIRESLLACTTRLNRAESAGSDTPSFRFSCAAS